MARKKGETSKVYNYVSDNDYSYSELLKSFNDMNVDSMNAFNKISLQKMILKLDEEINNLNRALETLKEVHTSLVDERYNVLDTLV